MSDSVTGRIVVDFALQSESDLRTALCVAEALPQIKKEVASGFLQQLRASLVRSVGNGWRVSEVPNAFDERWAGLSIAKPKWKDFYCINLEAQEYGRQTVLGVWRDRDKLRTGPNPDMVECFRDAKWPGKANRSWEWYIRIPPAFGSWNGWEALTKMRFQPEATLRYFKDQMLRAAEIAGPLLDDMRRTCKP